MSWISKKIPGCIVFARQGYYNKNHNNWGKIELKHFSKGISIHKTVNSFIAKKTGYLVIPKDAPEGLKPYYDQDLCKGVDLTNLTPFNFFLEDKPYLSFGHEGCPKKPGIAYFLKFYHSLVDDFLRMWKQGLYSKSTYTLETEMMKKYRIAPYIVFAESGLSEMERLLVGLGDIEADFQNIQKPKIVEALRNFKKYVEHNKGKENFENRLIDFTLARKLTLFPYTFFTSVIEKPAFDEIREELHLFYCFSRYIFKFHGVLFSEEKDELAELKMVARSLQKKTNEQGYT